MPRVELEDIESNLGLRFHSRLNRSSALDLCAVQGCQMMDYRSFQAFYIRRGISTARSFGELNRYWRKAVVSLLRYLSLLTKEPLL